MPQQAETEVIPPRPEACSTAERMRRYRQRRRDGFCCLWVELHATEIDSLVRKGLLQSVARNDVNAIREALYSHFEETLI